MQKLGGFVFFIYCHRNFHLKGAYELDVDLRDDDGEGHGGELVGAHDGAALEAVQLESSLDGRDHDCDQPVRRHNLNQARQGEYYQIGLHVETSLLLQDGKELKGNTRRFL